MHFSTLANTPLKNISDFRMEIADYKKVKKIHQISSAPIYWGRNKARGVSIILLTPLYFYSGGSDEDRTRDLRRDRPAF